MSSAQEAKEGAGFLNVKDMVPIRQILEELDYQQGPTPLVFDNKCAAGIMKTKMK